MEAQEKKAQHNEAQIDVARNAYKPFCRRASKLFSVLQSVRQLSPIYCFDLQFLLSQFKEAIRIGNKQAKEGAEVGNKQATEGAEVGNSILLTCTDLNSTALETKLQLFYSTLLYQVQR